MYELPHDLAEQLKDLRKLGNVRIIVPKRTRNDSLVSQDPWSKIIIFVNTSKKALKK